MAIKNISITEFCLQGQQIFVCAELGVLQCLAEALTMHSVDILNSSLTANITKSKKISAILSTKDAVGYGSTIVLTLSVFKVNVKSIQLKKGSANHSKQHRERTTRLLIVILVLFIVAELPQVNDELS